MKPGRLTFATLAILLGTATFAHAQSMPGMGGGGMPDMRSMSGKPLPDATLAPGTVTVRVGRGTPGNGAAGVEVTAIVRDPAGEARKRTAKADTSGRAKFEGLPAGHLFKAEVVVDGERLTTDEFPIPADAGIRTMVLAGVGAKTASAPGDKGTPAAAPAATEEGATKGEPGKPDAKAGDSDATDARKVSLGVTTGTTAPDATLPNGTVEVRVSDEAGKPMAGQAVEVLQGLPGGGIKIHRGTTDATGVARFQGLPTGATSALAAVTTFQQTRIGTAPFSLPDKGGLKAHLRGLHRTNDPTAVRVAEGGRIIVETGEAHIQVLEVLPFENQSDKLFVPGPKGLEVPLPDGFAGAQAMDGSAELAFHDGRGASYGAPIPPGKQVGGASPHGAGSGAAAFGFVLPYKGSRYEFSQRMPYGMGPFTLIVEHAPGLEVAGRGVGPRQERDVGGRRYWFMPVAGVAPGEELTFTLSGLPAPDSTGAYIAGALALLLVAAAVVFARRPGGAEARQSVREQRDALIAEREKLFGELVAFERAHPAGSRTGGDATRRGAIVGKLESVYRDLAALDQQHA